MKERHWGGPLIERVPRVTSTLGAQVRAEAMRRGEQWANRADECAAQAERFFGSPPLRGGDLHLVFDTVFVEAPDGAETTEPLGDAN